MQPSKLTFFLLFLSVYPKTDAKSIKICEKRAISTSVAKSGAALVAPLVAKSLKGALGMGRDTFEAYRSAAQKEASSGGWLTTKFIDLMYLPTIALLTNQIREIEVKMSHQHKERDDFFVTIVCLAAAVPTIMVTLILMCLINLKRVSRIRGNLLEQNRSIEVLSAATANRCGPTVRGAGQAQAGGSSTSGNPPGPVINFRAAE